MCFHCINLCINNRSKKLSASQLLSINIHGNFSVLKCCNNTAELLQRIGLTIHLQVKTCKQMLGLQVVQFRTVLELVCYPVDNYQNISLIQSTQRYPCTLWTTSKTLQSHLKGAPNEFKKWKRNVILEKYLFYLSMFFGAWGIQGQG